jgi:hypothetical protein
MTKHAYQQQRQWIEYRKTFLLSQLRCASLRCRLWAADLDSIGVALKGDWISPEEAIALLDSDACAFLGMPLIEEAAA